MHAGGGRSRGAFAWTRVAGGCHDDSSRERCIAGGNRSWIVRTTAAAETHVDDFGNWFRKDRRRRIANSTGWALDCGESRGRDGVFERHDNVGRIASADRLHLADRRFNVAAHLVSHDLRLRRNTMNL